MMHILLIAVFLAVYLRDGIDAPFLSAEAHQLGPVAIAAWSIGSLAAVWFIAHTTIWFLGRRIDRAGSLRAARQAETVLFACRLCAVSFHAFNILVLGWVDVVRGVVGNLVAVDEVLACLPVLLVFVMGWWSIYPVDRRLREAIVLHELDDGRAMPPMPTRAEFVINALRHQALWVLLPIVCILAWGEFIDRLTARHVLGHLEAGIMQFAGMVTLLIIMPLAMRHLWDTISLGAGPLRDRLHAMCQSQGVRVRDLLIWRTHGTMINGAVMGLVPRLRYILLTDALIEYLPPEQVEAVTAHELGHVRRRHIVWLALSALGSITVMSWLIQVAMELARPGLSNSQWAQGAAGAAALATGLLVFGYVSRRFEWQADAFSVQHLSGFHKKEPGVVLTAEAVGAMRGALEAVARLNHIPRNRFTWRHGSIATRQRKLTELVGMAADRLPIDRLSRGIAAVAAVVGLMAAGLIVWSGVSSESERPTGGGAAGARSMEVPGAIRQDAWDRE